MRPIWGAHKTSKHFEKIDTLKNFLWQSMSESTPNNNPTQIIAPPSPPIEDYDLYSFHQYPWMALNYFLALWVVAVVAHKALGRYCDSYKNLAMDKQRNVISYVLQLLITTLVFVVQLYAGRDILFRLNDAPTPATIHWLTYSILMINVLYIWELIYRISIGWPLLLHHLVTILLIQLVTATFFDTHQIQYLRVALLMGFHATTEQLSFVALALYRLQLLAKKWQSFSFFVSAAQSLLLKTAVTIGSLVYYAIIVQRGDFDRHQWGLFWMVSFVVLLLTLYAAQLYACYILYALGVRSQQPKPLAAPKSVKTELQEGAETRTELDDEEMMMDIDFNVYDEETGGSTV